VRDAELIDTKEATCTDDSSLHCAGLVISKNEAACGANFGLADGQQQEHA
jgi:hypothetical protein